MYQFRKRVPVDVRRIIGGPPVVKVTLGTKDPAKAAEEFRVRDAACEARWAEIRKGLQELNDEQVEALGGEVYRDMIGWYDKSRGIWTHHRHAWHLFMCEKLDGEMDIAPRDEWMPKLENAHGPFLDRTLAKLGMLTSEATRARLLLAAHRALKQADGVLIRQCTGDYTPDPAIQRFPDLRLARAPDDKQQFESVWNAWVKEAKPKPNTIRRWRPALDRMLRAVGHTDLGRISESDLRGWLGDLLDSGRLGNNTIAGVHLAAAKRIFSFAKANKLIAIDPSAEIAIASGKKYAIKMRDYEPHEVGIILRASLAPPSRRVSPELAAARRWVPWICAYTGARVNEVTQLRVCDITLHDGVALMHIRAEAGTTKTGSRIVPMHPHLVDQGFLDFLNAKKGEVPLFYRVTYQRRSAESLMPPYEEMGARLSKWVRKLGLHDVHIDPNHAWRHRFKTVAGEVGIPERVADAIQGHTPSTIGRRYGKVSTETMTEAINKLPVIDPQYL